MIINVPTVEELTSRMWAAVAAATGLTDTSESSVGYNIVKACATEAVLRWRALADVERAHDFSQATGSDLDRIGEMFGVYRRRASIASSRSTPRGIKFTNPGGATITIPDGTRVWDPDNPDISYFTTSAITIPGGLEGYVDVEAPAEGEYYNVGAARLVAHNAGGTGATVINEIPITTGTDIEPDSNYRARISQAMRRMEGPNVATLRALLMSVPGVRNATVLNLARGTGTIDVLIEGYDREVPDAVIAACQSAAEETVAAGVSVKIKAPELVYVDVTVLLNLKAGSSFTSVRSSVSEAIRGYIDNLPIEAGGGNGTLYMSELSARVQQADPAILSSKTTLTIDGVPALSSQTSDQRLQFGQKFASQALLIS